MRTISVSDDRELGRILDVIHDRPLDLSSIRLDSSNGTLSASLRVQADGVRDIQKFLFLSRWKIPVVVARLTVRNALDYALKDDAKTGEGLVNTINIRDGVIVIECSNRVELTVMVSSVEIELETSDQIVRMVSRYSFGSRTPLGPGAL